MTFNHLHWLDIAEYIALVLTFLSLFISFVSQESIYPVIFLAISLLFNLFNRLRLGTSLERRLNGEMKQLQEQWLEQIEALEHNLKNTQGLLIKPNQQESLVALQRDLEQLKAISQQINLSLDGSALLKKLDVIEQGYFTFQTKIKTISDQIFNLEAQVKAENLKNQNLPEYANSLEQAIKQIEHLFNSRIKLLEEQSQLIHQQESEARTEEIEKSQKISEPMTTQDDSLKVSQPPIPHWNYMNILESHSESVTDLAISSDGQLLASVSWDQTLKLWDLNNGNLIDSITAHDQGLLAVSFIGYKDNYRLATGSLDQNIKTWLVESRSEGKLVIVLDRNLNGHTGSVHDLAIAADKKILVSGSYDQTVKQWDIETGNISASSFDEYGYIYAIAVHESKELIASAGGDGSVTLWQLGNGKMRGFLGGNISSVESLAISPNGELVASGSIDGSIKIWHINLDQLSPETTIQPHLVITAHSGQVTSLVFSSEEAVLYSSGIDGKIKVWNLNNGEQLTVLDGQNRIFSLAISPDGKLLASGAVDGKIQLWNR